MKILNVTFAIAISLLTAACTDISPSVGCLVDCADSQKVGISQESGEIVVGKMLSRGSTNIRLFEDQTEVPVKVANKSRGTVGLRPVGSNFTLKTSAVYRVLVSTAQAGEQSYSFVIEVKDGSANVQPFATVAPPVCSAGQQLTFDAQGMFTCTQVSDNSVMSFAKQTLPVCGPSQALSADGTSFSCANVTDGSVKSFAKSELPVCTANQALSAVAGSMTCVSVLDSDKLPMTGGVLSGSLGMNGQKLHGLSTPVQGDEAANKSYVDDGFVKIPANGDRISIAAPSNTSAAAETVMIGGSGNIAEGKGSVVISGQGAVTKNAYEHAVSSGPTGAKRTQTLSVPLKGSGAGWVTLSPDSSGITLNLIGGASYICTLDVVGKNQVDGSILAYSNKYAIATDPALTISQSSGTTIAGSPIVSHSSSAASALRLSIRDGANGDDVAWSGNISCSLIGN
nr:hypothetical protein BdHM001_35580 [Bdellovibrio sp. HM001]